MAQTLKKPEEDGIVESVISPTTSPAPAAEVTDPAPNDVDASPTEYTAPTFTPVTTEVDAPTETVEGRLGTMLDQGSTYMRQAATDAKREANNRGLINSTMAAGAGTEAAIRAALPIAQQDAKTYTDTRMANQNTQNQFLENEQATALNKEFAAFESAVAQEEMKLDADLRLRVETTLNDERFSDEIKLQYVATINNIMRDSQQQITEIGLSDRTAEAQAAAIARVEANRNAEIKVYEDLLKSFDDWDWGTDFTPGSASATTAPSSGGGSTDPATSKTGLPSDPDYVPHGQKGWKDYYNSLNTKGYGSTPAQEDYNRSRDRRAWPGGDRG